MFLSVLISVVLAAATAPTPTALPTLPPLIIRTQTSAACTALHKYFLSMGYVTRRNDEAFQAMARSVRTFVAGIYPTDVPSAGELLAVQSSSGGDTGTEGDQLGDVNQDDTLLYGPGQILTAARVEDVVNQIYHNLVLEGKLMNESWKEYPSGSDAHVDELRQHLQNLMDDQRALADKYQNFAGTYLSNNGMTSVVDPDEQAYFKLYLRALLLGDVSELQENGSGTPDNEYVSASERAHIGSVGDVVKGLHDEERSYAPAVVTTINACNGAHYSIDGSAPQASPTP